MPPSAPAFRLVEIPELCSDAWRENAGTQPVQSRLAGSKLRDWIQETPGLRIALRNHSSLLTAPDAPKTMAKSAKPEIINIDGTGDPDWPKRTSDRTCDLMPRGGLENDVDWNRFASVIRAARRIVLVSHIRPDCDALGSQLGMAAILRRLGKNVRIVNGQRTPQNLQFIDPGREIMEIGSDITPASLEDVDLFLVLDTSAWAQLGPMRGVLESTTAAKAVLDHHVSEDDLGAEVFKRSTAEATGVLVVEAADALGVELDPEIARPLFAAVATDTGWFRFRSVRAETFECAARLMRAGAVPAEIYNALYEQETAGRMRLRGRVQSRIEVELDGRLAHTWIVASDYAETGALPSDTEDLVNAALQIRGTQFALILVEQKTGGFKISFRSRCSVDCNAVAAKFGGGGHKAAAGAFVEGGFEEVRHLVLDHVRNILQQTDAA